MKFFSLHLMQVFLKTFMENPKVYVVILNYKKWQDVWQCITSLLLSTYEHYNVLIIDNFSENGSLEELKKLTQIHYANQISSKSFNKEDWKKENLSDLAKITFIQNDKNTGFAAGNNLVLDRIKDEDAYVWLLNPDMTVTEDTMEIMVNYAATQNAQSIIGAEVRIWGGEALFFYGGSTIDFNKATSKYNKRSDAAALLDFISGGCLFTHLNNFQVLGLLPEHYFLYWEETDWCYNAKLMGRPLLICPHAICYDKVSSTIGKGYLSDYYYVRNGLHFIAKYNKGKIPSVIFFVVLRCVKRILSGQSNRAHGAYKGMIDYLADKKGRGH